MRITMGVFGRVFRAIIGATDRAKIQELQRGYWRIDQKLNRHLRGDTDSNTPSPTNSPFSAMAYPYLEDPNLPNPWHANGKEQPQPVSVEDGK